MLLLFSKKTKSHRMNVLLFPVSATRGQHLQQLFIFKKKMNLDIIFKVELKLHELTWLNVANLT